MILIHAHVEKAGRLHLSEHIFALLLEALQQGLIAAAGLDVTQPEPLSADSPLWAMENVIITAHYAGLTPRYTERALAIFLDNLARYRKGRPLRNIVAKKRGYSSQAQPGQISGGWYDQAVANCQRGYQTRDEHLLAPLD